MSAPYSSRASAIIIAIRSALARTAPTGKSNWARAIRRVIARCPSGRPALLLPPPAGEEPAPYLIRGRDGGLPRAIPGSCRKRLRSVRGLHYSRNAGPETPVCPDGHRARHPGRSPHAALHPLRQSVVGRYTRNQRCRGRSDTGAGTGAQQVADGACFATACVRCRSFPVAIYGRNPASALPSSRVPVHRRRVVNTLILHLSVGENRTGSSDKSAPTPTLPRRRGRENSAGDYTSACAGRQEEHHAGFSPPPPLAGEGWGGGPLRSPPVTPPPPPAGLRHPARSS